MQTKSFVAGAGVGADCDLWEESASQAHAARNLGSRPLIVLTAGKPFAVGDPEADKELAAFQDIWIHRLQPELVRLSTRGRQVIVESSSHAIGWEEPDAVVNAVREVVTEVRGLRNLDS
jgi:hypothetical protein